MNRGEVMKLIVAGSRGFRNYLQLKVVLDDLIKHPDMTTIISGTAIGADTLGERYANEHGIDLEMYPANWKKYGKSAGYKRNDKMASVATHCIVFWDGQSKGTKHMIDLAKSHGLKLKVVEVR